MFWVRRKKNMQKPCTLTDRGGNERSKKKWKGEGKKGTRKREGVAGGGHVLVGAKNKR